MKSIETLIKVHTQELDEKRRELVALEAQQEKFRGWARDMEHDLQREREFIVSHPAMSMTFDSYRKDIVQKQKNMAETLKELESQVIGLQERIAELFTEVKKYEVVLQQKQLAALNELKAREGKMMDEIAVNNYLRELGEEGQ